jgi:hypothetical protein
MSDESTGQEWQSNNGTGLFLSYILGPVSFQGLAEAVGWLPLLR